MQKTKLFLRLDIDLDFRIAFLRKDATLRKKAREKEKDKRFGFFLIIIFISFLDKLKVY